MRISVGAQIAQMRVRWHTFTLVSWRCGEARWVGTIRPTDASLEYRIQISYRLGRRPQVLVLTPPLRRRDDEPIPHLHRDGGLCLHLPSEWRSDRLIADTIVPWAALWLYYYEFWHATGEWLGGGVHLPVRAPRRSFTRTRSLTAGVT